MTSLDVAYVSVSQRVCSVHAYAMEGHNVLPVFFFIFERRPRNSTKLCHMFGNKPYLKRGVQTWGLSPQNWLPAFPGGCTTTRRLRASNFSAKPTIETDFNHKYVWATLPDWNKCMYVCMYVNGLLFIPKIRWTLVCKRLWLHDCCSVFTHPHFSFSTCLLGSSQNGTQPKLCHTFGRNSLH